MSAADTMFALSALASLGAALGAVGISFGELFYAKALADNRLEESEKDYIRATFWSLTWGMILFLVGSLGMVGVSYLSWNTPQPALTAPFWTSLILAVIIVCAGWALSKNKIPWWLGSGVGFSGWWMIFVLTSWREIQLSYLMLAITFVVATAVVISVFSLIRRALGDAAKK